ncbi:hypothetical protein ACLMJK_002362 [Lecanora helva]
MSHQSSPSRLSSRRSTPSKTKTVDIGKPLGVYDTNTVRDRVRQWQAQGGGVVTAEDIGEGEELIPEETPRRRIVSQKRSPARTPSKSDVKHQDPATPTRNARKPTRIDDDKSPRSRSRSAPAKRIVSDGHWKKKRTPPKSSSSSKPIKSAVPGIVQADDGVRQRPISTYIANDTRTVKEEQETPKRNSVGDNDGIRVYVTPPKSLQGSSRSLARSDMSEGEGGREHTVEARKSTQIGNPGKHRKSPTPDKEIPTCVSGETKQAGRRKSSGQQPVETDRSPRQPRGSPSESKGSVRSHKGNLLSQVFGESKKRVTRQAPEAVPAPRVPSIEAWLNETSDPFVETEEPPLEFIAPLQPSSRKEKPAPKEEVLEVVGDPNKIWASLDTKEGTRRAMTGSRRRKRIPSSAIYEDNPFPAGFDSDTGLSASGGEPTSASKFVDLVQEAPEMSPSSLKRRSARKSVSSPVRDRRLSRGPQEPNIENNDASGLSSNHTMSSVEGPGPNDPLKPPGLSIKRPFPSTGQHRLSTIASVDTLSTNRGAVPSSISEHSENTIHPLPKLDDEAAYEAQDQFDPNSLKRNNSRLTKHADLISVLSLPKPSSRSIQSARSIRTNRSKLATATIGDLMRELSTDENKYMRELRTLVDGVIPVLLTCVLSKSDSTVAAGLFRPSTHIQEDANFTKPIIDMGIALERLKTLHKRIPQDDAAAFLTWAHGAQRVYAEYLKAWRMGFQDVVVNLAPAADMHSEVSNKLSPRAQELDEGLPRNEKGDVINADGERVDVAFLLKRPLVRLKYLQKTLKGINVLKPSAEAESLAVKYQKLVDDARRRSNEERARLEDEAASNIDSTRTRDPRTLAPLAGVVIDRTRHVRARDNFNLALQHTSGQYVDCHVELTMRDDASNTATNGDLLISEMDTTGKWLLFPPIQSSRVSARNGDLKGEIVVMIRGMNHDGSEWQELFSLCSENEQTGFEWVQMLGLTPVPPKITRTQSFLEKHRRRKSTQQSSVIVPSFPDVSVKSRTPSPPDIQIPIGEQVNEPTKTWVEPPTDGVARKALDSLPEERQTNPPKAATTQPTRSSNYVEQVNDLRSLPSQNARQETTSPVPTRTPRSFKEALGLSGTSSTVGLKRARANRRSKHGGSSPSSPSSQERRGKIKDSCMPSSELAENFERGKSPFSSPHESRSLSPEPSEQFNASAHEHATKQSNSDVRPSNPRSRSSVPSMELPYIPKARRNSPPATPTFEPEQEPEWPSPAKSTDTSPSKLDKQRSTPSRTEVQAVPSPPATPVHRSPSPVHLNGTKTPKLASTQVKSRRSSSPLKHEYEPSTASETSSDSDTFTIDHKEATSVSDSSEDEELEEGDAPTPLLPLGALKRLSNTKPPTRTSSQSTPEGSIKPSESASQAPYKKVPAQPTKATKTIASIYSWSDTGAWQSLHPDECSIVITPGLIEAFEMSAAHSKDVPLSSPTPIVDADAFSEIASNVTSQNDDVRGDRPLIALELTPLVPLRRGTALDISIRSPPASNSQITSGTNIMFRSRNPEECEALYALINHSRINNPTFIALQNARASGSSFGAGRRATTSNGNSKRSWFGGWGRSSSYRASSAPTPSIVQSDSSIGSMSSAFSALRRFGRGGSMFNISRSTITSREGSRANSIYTSSDNSSGSGASSPLPPGLASAGAPKDAALGISNAKIRLYVRETASKWRDMGSARLTIMRPEKNDLELPGGAPASGGAQPNINEKRIVINGKTKGEVLLDVQLGESRFERVARTGIAISVWEDVVGPNGEVGVVAPVGGVSGGRASVYMIQMKSEAETAYTFSIVGRLRY